MSLVGFSVAFDRWIPVLDTGGRHREVSIREALIGAGGIRRVVCEVPSQDVAILRLLLAVWLRAGGTVAGVESYLERWAHRMVLDDAEQPFLQSPGLRSASGRGSGLEALMGRMYLPPADQQMRPNHILPPAPESLSMAEAARWLVHCHAFDPSGIRTGLVDDPETTRGKGMPRGSAWCARGSHVWVDAGTLAGTLNLLAVPVEDGSLAAWEAPAVTAGDRGVLPGGRMELLTWSSRRLLLGFESGRVVDCLVGQGDRVEDVAPLRDVDPTMVWANRPAGVGWVPVRVQATARWQMVARALGVGRPAPMDTLPADIPRGAEVVVVTPDLGPQASVWVDLRQARWPIDPRFLTAEGLGLLVQAAELCVGATVAAARYASHLVQAAGGDDYAQRGAADAVQEQAAVALDPAFSQWARSWLDDPLAVWRRALYDQMRAIEQNIAHDHETTAALIGRRRPDGTRIDAALAAIFYAAARKKLCSPPNTEADSEVA